ncbi:MAG: IS66 family transposase [Caldilineaceae bacterium SB0661_bin_34]|nr:IS66 family transposase [Caldilineaceae bacterium SB0661_bin_34]
MSAPSLADRLALVAADPALVGHPVVAGLVAVVGELECELVSLREENAELRRQLGRHSGNSGQPPSQDGPSAPPRRRRRRRSRGRKPGGQPGHAGRTRRPVAAAQVDVRVEHWPVRCDRCGNDLPRVDAGAPARRQIHDLPAPPPLAVTEHRTHAVRCPGCGTRTRAAFPAGVAGPVRYGPRLEALVAYLRYAQHLPVGRLRDLLRELHGAALSTGTVEALCRRVVGRLAARADHLRKQALALPVAGMDETALRVAGGTLWLHVICDDNLTFYRLGARGAIWVEYAGTAVHDRFASYLSQLPEETAHGLCNAHLLRNLEEIVERERVPDGWAARMQRLLLKARDTAAYWCDTTGGPVPEPLREQTAAAWDTLLQPVLEHYESLPPPARGRRRGHNLALALWTLRDACLLFMADPAVPFTNNRAERALRMAKLQMKISGGFRTRAGAERFARMRGLVETARKQGHNLLDLLRQDPDAPTPQPNPVPP